jgi:hypothetical protein
MQTPVYDYGNNFVRALSLCGRIMRIHQRLVASDRDASQLERQAGKPVFTTSHERRE